MLNPFPPWQPNMTRLDQVRQTVETFIAPGQVTEVRALAVDVNPNYQPVYSGYFDCADAILSAVTQLPESAGIYLIPNPVDPRLLARAVNRLIPARGGMTTADTHIVRRRYFMVDLDPLRPSGISSTNEELSWALAKADVIRSELNSEGWPTPITACSGNGAHLIFKVDLPTDDGGLITNCLETLSRRFGDDRVSVDTAVGNPARGFRLYGTRARKGDPTPDRPHRHSEILSTPEDYSEVSKPLLTKLATAAGKRNGFANAIRQPSFNLESWLLAHSLPVTTAKPWKDGQLWPLKICPWNSEHRNSSAYIIQLASGKVLAGCHHTGCHGKNWEDLRDIVEPDWRRKQHRFWVPTGAPPAIADAFRRAALHRKNGGLK